MKFMLFDKDENYIKNINIISPKHTEETNGEETLEFSTMDEVIDKGYRIVFMDLYGDWKEFIVQGIEEIRNEEGIIKEVFCESSFYETIGDFIEDKKPRNVSVSTALGIALAPTRWEVGNTDGLGINSINIYRTNSKEAVQSILERWEGEIKTRVVVSGNKITRRYLDAYNKRGNDLGKRFTYTKDLEEIKKIIHREDVITALYGFGKGEEIEGTDGYGRRIDFAELNNGKMYVENNKAKEIWGRNNPNGTKSHVFGKVEFDDCEDKTELLELTKEKLKEVSSPLVTYETRVIDLKAFGFEHEGTELGDVVTVIDKEFSPELRIKARVVKIVRHLLEPEENEITLGNFITTLVDSNIQQQEYINNFRNKSGIWDRADYFDEDGLNSGYLKNLVDELNERMNSTGGYTYLRPGKGIEILNKPEDQNPTESIFIGGGYFRIADRKKADGSWDYKTFGTGKGFVADLITTGNLNANLIKAGVLSSRDGSTWINLENSHYSFADMITWDGEEFKINFTKAGLAVGVANLIRRSKEKQNSSSYLVGIYDITEDWETNTTYTISLKGSINDSQKFGIWANGTGTRVATLNYDPEDDLYKATFTTPSTIGSQEPKTLRVYNYPSTGATSASIDWVKLEKGEINTGWTPAEGELDGANYTFDGLNAIFRGAGLKIINAEDYPVFHVTTDGLLNVMGQLTTGYKEGYNTSVIGNGIHFEARPPSGNKYDVGYLSSGLNPFGANGELEEGLSLSHNYGRHISIGGITNQQRPYTYLVFDRENRLGYIPEFPTIFILNTAFNARTSFYGNMDIYGIAKIYNKINFETGTSNKPSIDAVNDWLYMNSYNFSINGSSGSNPRIEVQASTGKIVHFWDTACNKSLTVYGKKNAVQVTENYGERLINAYETAEYYFGDIGSGKIGEDGKCYIYIDNIFQECVNTGIEYHVFLQKCGQGDVWIKEKHETYFIVEGTEGLEFSWELKAKRLGYEYDRLEQPDDFDLDIDDSVSFDRDFEQEDEKDKELEKTYEDELKFDLLELLLKEVA